MGSRIQKVCAQCAASYSVKASYAMKSSYCSRGCMSEAYKARMRGTGNPNYRHGLTLTPEGCEEVSRRWREKNPARFVAIRAHANKLAKARRKGAPGAPRRPELDRLWESQLGRCAACTATLLVEGSHLDHKIAIIRGGTNFIGNLQYLCAQCNLRKKTLLPIEHRVYNLALGTEEIEQAALFKWVHENVATYPALAFLIHIPNGGLRNKRTAARLMAAGVRRGVPDLSLPVPVGEYHGLYIEMKAGKNKPTTEQLAWLAALAEQGYRVGLCYSAKEAAVFLTNYLKPDAPTTSFACSTWHRESVCRTTPIVASADSDTQRATRGR